MWYEYQQNNSGGIFIQNKKLDKTVFVEAQSYFEANVRAMELGIYFNGVDRGKDCNCCGDRWDEAYPTIEVQSLDKIFKRMPNEDFTQTIFYHSSGKITSGRYWYRPEDNALTSIHNVEVQKPHRRLELS